MQDGEVSRAFKASVSEGGMGHPGEETKQLLQAKHPIRRVEMLCPDTRVQVEVWIGKLVNAWL